MANRDLVKSLLKGLDILQMVSLSENGVALQEVTQRLNIKGPTAHNLLRTLLERKFIEKSGKPIRYKLGEAAVEMSDGFRRRSFLLVAREIMNELDKRLYSATITLAELVSGEVSATLRLSPDSPGRFEYRTKRVFSPYSSVSALVFQAFMTDEQLQAFRRNHPFWEYGGHIWKSPEALDEFLKQTVKNGYACPVLSEKEAVFTVAVPVFGHSNNIRATLGVAFKGQQPSSVKKRAYMKHIINAAENLSAECAKF